MTDEARDQANVALMLDQAIAEKIASTLVDILADPNSTSPLIPLLHRKLEDYERARATTTQADQTYQERMYQSRMQSYAPIQSVLGSYPTQSSSLGTGLTSTADAMTQTIKRVEQEYKNALRK